MSEPIDEDLERLIRFFVEAADEMTNITAEVLAAHDSAAGAAWDLLGNAVNFHENYLGRLKPPFQSACAAGCDFCCYQHVSATIPEVIVLAERIRTQWPEDARADLLAKLEAYRRDTDRLEPSEVAATRRPCPLLRDRRCSVYELRPNCVSRLAQPGRIRVRSGLS